MSAPVGADIESICRKCGDVWHVVVAKDGERIAKVQCKQCSGYHRYKPPGGSARVPRSPRASKRESRSQQPVSRRIDEPQVAANAEKPILPYRFSDSYEPGDRIEHPKFGFGVVEVTAEPGKMQVFFPDGRRVLAIAKRDLTLSRPSRVPSGSLEPPKW